MINLCKKNEFSFQKIYERKFNRYYEKFNRYHEKLKHFIKKKFKNYFLDLSEIIEDYGDIDFNEIINYSEKNKK